MTATLQAPPKAGKLAVFKETMQGLDAIAQEAGMNLSVGNGFSQAITMASGIIQLREALTDEIMDAVFLPLMNSRLGFRTDKDPSRGYQGQPYSREVVRECIIEATLRGLPPVGNCFNIIAGSTYVTKEGFWYLLSKRVAGLTDFKISVGVPRMVAPAGDARNASNEDAKGALVTCFAVWKLNGKDDRTDREIPIRVNSMMGADAIMGKAERKILAAAFAQITGTTLGDADADTDDLPAQPMRTVNPAGVPRSKPAPTGEGFQTVEEPETKPAASNPERFEGGTIAWIADVKVVQSPPNATRAWTRYEADCALSGGACQKFTTYDGTVGEALAKLDEDTRVCLWLSGTQIKRFELAPEGGEG